MESLSWIIWGLMTLVSTLGIWIGLRQKDLSLAIIGVGIATPTYGWSTGLFWAMGVALTALGVWLRRNDW